MALILRFNMIALFTLIRRILLPPSKSKQNVPASKYRRIAEQLLPGERNQELYDAVKNKVSKNSHEPMTFKCGAIERCKELLKNGAYPHRLVLFKEDFNALSKKQKEYYLEFLKRLNKIVQKSKYISQEKKEKVANIVKQINNIVKKEINTRVKEKSHDKSDDSGIGSCIESCSEEDSYSLESSSEDELHSNNIEDGPSTSRKDQKSNEVINNLHAIARQSGKQKCEFLDKVIQNTPQESLESYINSQKDGKTPLQVALIAKVSKTKHKSNTVRDNDNTLKFIAKLLQHGADHTGLKLLPDQLCDLNKEQTTYYYGFLKKLSESIKQSELDQKIKDKIIIKIAEIIDNGYPLHSAVRNKEKDRFFNLLKIDCDITTQDEEGNNVLHYIALLKKNKKVDYLDRVLNYKIPKYKLYEAVNAVNNEGYTPLQVALTTKARKPKIEYLKQETFFDLKAVDNNTTQFCAKLLESGASPDSLELKDRESKNEFNQFHTKRYYFALRNLKYYPETPPNARKEARGLKEKLEEKYGCRTASKACKSGAKSVAKGCKSGVKYVAKKTKSAVKAIGRFIDPGRRAFIAAVAAVTITIIIITIIAFAEGAISPIAAISLIAAAGICLALTLLGCGVHKGFSKKPSSDSPKDESKFQPTIETKDQRLANDPEEKAEQLEFNDAPVTGLNSVSITSGQITNSQQSNRQVSNL